MKFHKILSTLAVLGVLTSCGEAEKKSAPSLIQRSELNPSMPNNFKVDPEIRFSSIFTIPNPEELEGTKFKFSIPKDSWADISKHLKNPGSARLETDKEGNVLISVPRLSANNDQVGTYGMETYKNIYKSLARFSRVRDNTLRNYRKIDAYNNEILADISDNISCHFVRKAKDRSLKDLKKKCLAAEPPRAKLRSKVKKLTSCLSLKNSTFVSAESVKALGLGEEFGYSAEKMAKVNEYLAKCDEKVTPLGFQKNLRTERSHTKGIVADLASELAGAFSKALKKEVENSDFIAYVNGKQQIEEDDPSYPEVEPSRFDFNPHTQEVKEFSFWIVPDDKTKTGKEGLIEDERGKPYEVSLKNGRIYNLSFTKVDPQDPDGYLLSFNLNTNNFDLRAELSMSYDPFLGISFAGKTKATYTDGTVRDGVMKIESDPAK